MRRVLFIIASRIVFYCFIFVAHSTSSTAGGRRVNVTLYGHNYTLSGVAPGAWLMNYRFLDSDSSVNVMVDDIFRDNPDISSNSWGPNKIFNSNFEDYKFMDSMMDNEIFVSVAIGNDGPQQLTASASVEKSIVVGACTKEDIAYYNLEVSGMNKAFTCIASKQTLGIKENYNLDILRDSVEDGCDSTLGIDFPENTAVLLFKGGCEYYEMAVNSKSYGAEIMIIGDSSPYKYCTTVLPSIHCDFDVAIEIYDYIVNLPDAQKLQVNLTRVREDESTKDKVAYFSSRGPTPDMKLVPDVIAPGVKVLAAGYGDGEDPRLGFNYVDGSSMSAPIVSGAAAIILQKHPEFTTEEVKSALMTTADFVNVMRQEDDNPAQPLDMGAGRINLEKAVNPALYISPPKVDFSLAQKPNKYSKTLKVHSYSDNELTVSVRVVRHTGYDQVTPVESYLGVYPSEFTLNADKKDVNVTFSLDTSTAELGDENAYVLFEDKNSGKEIAHVPLWGQVTCPEEEKKDVLLVVIHENFEGGYCDSTTFKPITSVYTKTLAEIGLKYDVIEHCSEYGIFNFPEKAIGLGYRSIIFALGDVSDPLTDIESSVQRIMHAGVPVIQMGSGIPYTWKGSKSIDAEFGFEDMYELRNVALSTSEYFVDDICFLPENPESNIFGDYLFGIDEVHPVIISEKATPDNEGLKSFNSMGLTSFVGLNQFKDEYQKKILSMMYGSLETKSSFNVNFVLDKNVAAISVIALDKTSKISSVVYNCGNGEPDVTKNETATEVVFKCTYSENKVYNVGVYVDTIFGRNFSYTLSINVVDSYSNKVALSLLLVILLMCLI